MIANRRDTLSEIADFLSTGRSSGYHIMYDNLHFHSVNKVDANAFNFVIVRPAH